MNKTSIIVTILVILAGGLFFWSYRTSPSYEFKQQIAGSGVECLTMGHQNIGQHFHPELQIIVDGSSETIPANLGVLKGCMAEIHTHDSSGAIHVETIEPNKQMTLGQFFKVWGEPIERDGMTLTMTVDGAVTTDDIENLLLVDHQKIVLTYTTTAIPPGETF